MHVVCSITKLDDGGGGRAASPHLKLGPALAPASCPELVKILLSFPSKSAVKAEPFLTTTTCLDASLALTV